MYLNEVAVVLQDVTNGSLGRGEEQPSKKEVSFSRHFHPNSFSLSLIPIGLESN